MFAIAGTSVLLVKVLQILTQISIRIWKATCNLVDAPPVIIALLVQLIQLNVLLVNTNLIQVEVLVMNALKVNIVTVSV